MVQMGQRHIIKLAGGWKVIRTHWLGCLQPLVFLSKQHRWQQE